MIGYIIGVGLFILALLTKGNDLRRASLVILLGIALLAIPTYISGNAAQDTIKSLPGVSKSQVEAHEGAAWVAIMFMEFSGAFAWLGLWQIRRLARVPSWNVGVILILTLVSLGLMIRASNLGGEIRHPEIVSGQQAADPPAANAADAPPGLARVVGSFVTDTPWMWPTCETLHFLGLSLLLGVVLLVDLRVLGVIKGVSFPSLHRLLPWAALGFGINVITGMLFFTGLPVQYIHNPSFYWKMAFVLIAGANAIYFTLLEEPWDLGPGEDAPFTAKFAAGSAMILWIAVLYCGSMLPFLGNAF